MFVFCPVGWSDRMRLLHRRLKRLRIRFWIKVHDTFPKLFSQPLEPEFSKTLDIRKAMGRAAIRRLNKPEERLTFQHEAAKLILRHLIYPSALQSPALRELRDTVRQAIALRDDMTRELAIYRCLWYLPGKELSGFEEHEGSKRARSSGAVCLPGFY